MKMAVAYLDFYQHHHRGTTAYALWSNPAAVVPLFLAERGEDIKLVCDTGHEDGAGLSWVHGGGWGI